ncbi:hypothetical protein ABIF66_002347 [Bradyrhizobium japonicum]
MRKSAFTKAVIREIIDRAKDRNGNQALSLAAEKNLGDALRLAERLFRVSQPPSKRDIERQKRLAITPAQERFVRAAIRTAEGWRRLTEDEKWSLAWISEPMNVDIVRWTDRSTKHLKGKVRAFDRIIEALESLTVRDAILRRPRGHMKYVSLEGRPLFPLMLFSEILKEWWEKSTGLRFAHYFDDSNNPKPMNAASCFLVAAASYLPERYTGNEIKMAMRSLQKKGGGLLHLLND